MKQLKINNQFVTQKKISQGSFGIVFQGIDQKNGNQVAIKVERPENEHLHSLDKEIEILSRLSNIIGVPQIFYHGWEDSYNVIVMELLQKDLASILKQRKKFSLKSVFQLSIELVLILEQIHKQGVLHRDLKPENMMLDDKNKVYLIDFGISKIYIRKNGILMPFKDRLPFIGTSRYASIAAHKGFELGRKDDLESLFYVMLYCLKGNLPWQNIKHVPDDQKTQKIGQMKENIEVKELFKDLPIEFIKIQEYLRKLNYASEPDYKTIVNLIQQAAKHANIVMDHKYEWETQLFNYDKNMNRYGTLQIDELPQKQYEKFSSNLLNCNNLLAQTPSKFQQLQPPTTKQESQQNSYSNYGSGNQNLSIYNSMGIIYQRSIEEISEEVQEPIPDELKSHNKIYLQTLPDQLKKPQPLFKTTQFDDYEYYKEDNLLSEKYHSLSAQITTIFQIHKK
ncbi:unnamed protein product [Paramecium pentaurelia]|uniref:Casein kinase I n=1 Tax=Paramecium pentaurelia TaxID=43138 RepID=A0A8S1SH97_9CILI|nr:unnamed protein product [Paramecium pentaurelia]